MMKPKNKKRLLILLFISFFLAFFSLAALYDRNLTNELIKKNKMRRAIIGNISFKGRVINSVVTNRLGKPYYIMCVKLDYTNTNDIYIFNDLCALKIKNGIATMLGGVYDENFIVDYVEVNIKKDNKEKDFYKNGETREFEAGLSSVAVEESDMNLCN